MDGFALVVRFTLERGHEAAFDALVTETLEGIRTLEPGTLVYASHRPDGEPGVRIFYELYRDREALAEHERQPHTRRFLAERGRHVAATAVDVLQLLDGTGTRPAAGGELD